MIAVIEILGDKMTKKKGSNFSPEFRLETPQLVVDQGYTHKEEAEAIDSDLFKNGSIAS